jgi:hypothetical protein
VRRPVRRPSASVSLLQREEEISGSEQVVVICPKNPFSGKFLGGEMSRFVAGILVVSLLASVCVMAVEGPATAKPKPAAKKKAPTMADQLQALQNQINQQQSQMKMQQDQINGLQQQLQQSNSQLQMQSQQLQSGVQQANQNAAAAQQSVNALNSSVTDLKACCDTTTREIAGLRKRVMDLESPLAVHYKGITFMPIGVVSTDFFYRNRNDVGTGNTNGFEGIVNGAVPFGGTTNANLSVFRVGARESKFGLRADGMFKDTKVSFWYDMDWYGQAPTANEGQTYSYQPRVRQVFVDLTTKKGWFYSFGMGWDLLMPYKDGTGCCSNYGVNALMGVDFNINAGFAYLRAPYARIAKELIPKKLWFGLQATDPNTATSTIQGYANPTFASGTYSQSALTYPWNYGNYTATTAISAPAGSLAGLAFTNNQSLTFPSSSVVPDIEFKFVAEPGWGHYELGGVFRTFEDRPVCMVATGCSAVNGTAFGQGKNNTVEGYGVVGNFSLPVVKKNKANLIFHTMAGKGIGRWSPFGAPDVTAKPNGSIVAVPNVQALVGIEGTPKPNFDFYLYFGEDYTSRTAYPVTAGVGGFTQTGYIGYGVPNALQTYCGSELTGSTFATALGCNTANRLGTEIQLGFWHRLWTGPQGILQWGAGYAWMRREVWTGQTPSPTSLTTTPYNIGLGTGGNLKNPIGVESAAQLTLRYILP